MDPTTVTIVTWAAGLAVTTLVGVLTRRSARHERENKSRDDAHNSLEREYRMFLANLPLMYVTKDDYRRDIDEIKLLLRELRDEVKSHG